MVKPYLCAASATRVLILSRKLPNTSKNNHENPLNDDSYNDNELYEGFDKEGHRMVKISVKIDLLHGTVHVQPPP